MIRTFCLPFLFLLTSFNAIAETQITLAQQNLQLNYSDTVRLSQILSDSQTYLPRDAFAPNFKLFDHQKLADITELKDSVIHRLMELEKNTQLTPALRQQITSFSYAHRLDLNLDVDAVRLSTALDPKLAGAYTLVTTPRSKHVQIVGLIDQIQTVQHQPTATLRHYLEHIEKQTLADNSYVWLIKPNGEIQKSGVAYWNNNKTPAMPGSLLFIGFTENKPEFAQLNLDIATLLTSIVSPL